MVNFGQVTSEIELGEICTFETIRQKLAYLTEYLNNRRMELVTINLCTKYKAATFTHYTKIMKGDENAKIGVVWKISGPPRSSPT